MLLIICIMTNESKSEQIVEFEKNIRIKCHFDASNFPSQRYFCT